MTDLDLPFWTKPGDGWRRATPSEKADIESRENAGCGGACYVNDTTGERVLCDGADMVLWSSIVEIG